MALIAPSSPEADLEELLDNGHIEDIATGGNSPQLTCNLQVDYKTEELAQIVMVALSVDPELKPGLVKRTITVEGKRLIVKFVAAEPKSLRSSFSAFLDVLDLANRTIEEFGPGTQYMPEVVNMSDR